MNKNYLLSFAIILLVSVTLVSASLNVQLSDQGTGASYNNGTVLDSANLTVLIYTASSGGSPIYNETFSNAISSGSWNVMLGSGVNLLLEFGRVYYKDYLINTESANFDGADRQAFYSPLGDINGSDLATDFYINTIGNINTTGNITFGDTILFNSVNRTLSANQTSIYYFNGTAFIDLTQGGNGTSSPWSSSTNNVTNITTLTPIPTNETVNINMTGNITTKGTGFFGWLGSLVNRITTIWVQDININGTMNLTSTGEIVGDGKINITGDIITTGNLTGDWATLNNLNVTGTSYLGDTIINVQNITTNNLNVTGKSYLGDTTINADNITVNRIVSRDGNISFYNNTGSEKVRITNDGNIGIGTTSPTDKLDVNGDTNINGTIFAKNYSSDGDIIFINESDVEIVRFTADGDVGIGTSTPSTKLQVNGSIGIISFNDSANINDYSGYELVNINGTLYWNGTNVVSGISNSSSGGAFYGSLAWVGTTGCDWTVTGTDFQDFPADLECDDNVRIARGLTTSDTTVGSVDGQTPQIKFDSMPAGYYKVFANGFFDSDGSDENSYRFSINSLYNSTSTPVFDAQMLGSVTGEIFVPTDLGVTNISVQCFDFVGTPCQIANDVVGRDFSISVYYFPSFGTAKNDTVFSDLDGDTRINVDANGGDSDLISVFIAGVKKLVFGNSTVSDAAIEIYNSTSSFGAFRYNDNSSKLEFSHDSGGNWSTVGSGSGVGNGTNDYLLAKVSGSAVLSAGSIINFNTTNVSSGSSITNNGDGTFTLDGGKTYEISVGVRVSATDQELAYSIFEAGIEVGAPGVTQGVGTTGSFGAQPTATAIVNPSSNTVYSVNATSGK